MKLFNSLTREKQEFVPIEEGAVKMYSCGPTVYNYFHVGNARPFIIFDTLRRYLLYKGYKVKFVQNFTDIDDKMINKANELGITVKELGEQYINEYFKDAQYLGISKADEHPLATENIDEIIKIIKTLEEKGFAYNKNGDVYFSTKKFDEYGKLSHQPLEDLESGARIDISDDKNDPMDFALWKSQKPGEPAWQSPWGMGRPGWHIECSAMVNKYLGNTIDIHSGGADLIFPHHENEIAQSECANGTPFANYWLHNGYINVDNKKMSKSLGNFFTVRDIAKDYDGETVRFFMLSAHYRSPINFSRELIDSAKAGLDRIYTCLKNLEFLKEKAQNTNIQDGEKGFIETLENYKAKFIDAMDDDINTADAISVLFEIVSEANRQITHESNPSVELLDYTSSMLKELGEILGLLGKSLEDDISPEIKALVEERAEARKQKDWKKSDEIRDKLLDMGIIIEDTAQGAKIKRVGGTHA